MGIRVRHVWSDLYARRRGLVLSNVPSLHPSTRLRFCHVTWKHPQNMAHVLIGPNISTTTKHDGCSPVVCRGQRHHHNTCAGGVGPHGVRDVINSVLYTLMMVEYCCLPVGLDQQTTGR